MGKYKTEDQVEFKRLLDVSGLSPAEIARRLEVSKASVSRILAGEQNPRSTTMQALHALVAKLKPPPESKFEDESHPQNKKIPIVGSDWKRSHGELRFVPVVSFARAGVDGFDYEDLGTHFDDWVPTDSKDPNAFALIVENDSMETRYSAGDILVVNPNEEPRNGDLVVARLENSGGVLFKLYHLMGPDGVRLTSYNKDLYPPLEYKRSAFRFIYPIVNITHRMRR